MRAAEFEKLVEEMAGALEGLLERALPSVDSSKAGCCATAVGFSMDALVRCGVYRVGWEPGLGTPAAGVAALIDHTLLKPEATESDLLHLCDEAAEHGFASVCVNPVFVELCRRRLMGSSVKTCTVIGFPLGATLARVKAAESRLAQDLGAQELDMVIPIGLLKSGHNQQVQDHIEAVVATRRPSHLVKVIIETCLLSDDEKRIACRLAVAAGADYVKTSTGFSKGGATIEDVALMREEVGPALGVKAAGGVHSHEELLAMVKAGATRIGASAGLKIVREAG